MMYMRWLEQKLKVYITIECHDGQMSINLSHVSLSIIQNTGAWHDYMYKSVMPHQTDCGQLYENQPTRVWSQAPKQGL